MCMMERKNVLRRRVKFLTLISLLVALTSAVLLGLNLASFLFPASTMQVPVPISPPSQVIPHEAYSSALEITFQAPPLDANTTLYGNVTLCCVLTMPRTTNGVIYFSTPELFIFSESEYITMKGTSGANPLNSPSEVSINGQTFSNYTLNGTAGTEILSIQFTPKHPGVYYFIVEAFNGETQAQLHLTYYKTQTVENKWVSGFQLSLQVLTILGLIVSAVGYFWTLRAPSSLEPRASDVKPRLGYAFELRALSFDT